MVLSGEMNRRKERRHALRTAMETLRRLDPDAHAELVAMMARGEMPSFGSP
jgi:hypothetical protein